MFTLDARFVQITTLVNARERLVKSERTLNALRCVGTAVNGAVDRFVAVGVAIAAEHAEIQRDMEDACDEARQAGMCAMRRDRLVCVRRGVTDRYACNEARQTGMCVMKGDIEDACDEARQAGMCATKRDRPVRGRQWHG